MPSDELKHTAPKNNSSLTILLLNISFICAFGIILLITLHDRSCMHNAFTYLSYYILLGLTATWAISLINLYQYKKSNASLFIRRHWKGILISFLLASVTFVSVPKYFRVLSDETNLLSVAKSMTYYKTVENFTEGRWYFEMYWSTPTKNTEKRPFLFPFFTSLLHTLLGYHVENVFILNYFALWTMLFLLYIAMHRSLGNLWSISALILVVSQPVIALTATSGSVEIFNLLFILASFLALRYFLDDPNHKTFIALVMTLIMLANVRYESILFLAVTLLFVTAGGYVKPKFLSQSLAYAIAPFFLLPLIWQRILLASESDPNLVGGSWIKAFQFDNAQHNIILFFKYILETSGRLGYAGIIDIAGILAVLVIGFVYLSKERNSKLLVLWACSIVSLSILFTILIFYQGGINDHPLNGRLYIPILVPLSIAPIYFAAHILKDKQKLAVGTLIFSLAVFVFYHPIAVEDRLTNNLMIIREYRYVDAFLKKNADKNTLIICGRPGQLIVSNYGALSYTTANRQVDNILRQFKNHLFSKIYVIQSIAYKNNSPLNDNVVNSRYQLETVDELQILGSYYFRISQVKALNSV